MVRFGWKQLQSALSSQGCPDVTCRMKSPRRDFITWHLCQLRMMCLGLDPSPAGFTEPLCPSGWHQCCFFSLKPVSQPLPSIWWRRSNENDWHVNSAAFQKEHSLLFPNCLVCFYATCIVIHTTIKKYLLANQILVFFVVVVIYVQ